MMEIQSALQSFCSVSFSGDCMFQQQWKRFPSFPSMKANRGKGKKKKEKNREGGTSGKRNSINQRADCKFKINFKKRKKRSDVRMSNRAVSVLLGSPCSIGPHSLVLWCKTQFTMCLTSAAKNCIFLLQKGCEVNKCKMLRVWEVLTVSLLPLSICFKLYFIVMLWLLFCSLCVICWWVLFWS